MFVSSIATRGLVYWIQLNVTTYFSPLRVVFFEDACFLNEKKCQNKADIVLKMPLFVGFFYTICLQSL